MEALLTASPLAASALCYASSPRPPLPASSAHKARLARSARCLAANQSPPEDDRGSGAGWRVRPKVAAQAAIAVAAAGFVDAGYSGDWSRIGVISTDTEHALQLAALAVVPLAAVAIFLLWDRHTE